MAIKEITVTIQDQRDTTGGRQVKITGDGFEGAIDTPAEALAVLNAAGLAAGSSSYIAGGKTLNYAQLVCLSQPASAFAKEPENKCHTEGTTYDSVSNMILKNPALYDYRSQADGAPMTDATGTARVPNTALEASSLFTGANALPAAATVSRVEVTCNGTVIPTGKGSLVPAAVFNKAGFYAVRIFYRMPNTRAELFRDARVRFSVPAPVVAPKAPPPAPLAAAPAPIPVRPAPAPSVAPGRVRPSRNKRKAYGAAGAGTPHPGRTRRHAGSPFAAAPAGARQSGTARDRTHAGAPRKQPGAGGAAKAAGAGRPGQPSQKKAKAKKHYRATQQ